MEVMNLEVGSVTIGLEFEDDKKLWQFKEYFQGYYGLRKPDIYIKLQFSDNGIYQEIPNSLFLTKKVKRNRFLTGNGLIRGKYNANGNKWSFLIQDIIVNGEYSRVFEQILYQAYRSVVKNKYSYLIHSCGVIKDNRGYLFVGPSEAGKSTIAQLSSNFHVINDEICIVDLSRQTPFLSGTPFNGLFRDKKPGEAPLKGIYLLNKAPVHSVEKISGGNAIKSLANEIIPPIELKEMLSSNTYVNMLDASLKIFEKVPVFRLNFLQDPCFWDLI